VFEWMESHDVHEVGIDVRRFTSFGVIKGFLRRVHRYPVFIPESPTQPNRRRRQSFSSTPAAATQFGGQLTSPQADSYEPFSRIRGRLPDVSFAVPVHAEASFGSSTREAGVTASAPRRISAAEKVLEQLRSKTLQRSGSNTTIGHPPSSEFPEEVSTAGERSIGRPRVNSDGRRHSVYQQSEVSNRDSRLLGYGPVGSISAGRPRPSRSPSAPMVPQIHTSFSQGSGQSLYVPAPPPELISLLDGEHHTDELSTRFEAGWPLLQQWLAVIGGGRGDGDLGRVSIIYR